MCTSYVKTPALTAGSSSMSFFTSSTAALKMMTLLIPLVIFALAQRFFVQGIVITGVDK